MITKQTIRPPDGYASDRVALYFFEARPPLTLRELQAQGVKGQPITRVANPRTRPLD